MVALRHENKIRREAEMIAHENKKNYHNLFNMVPIGISVTDRNGTICEHNREFGRLTHLDPNNTAINWNDLPVEFIFNDPEVIANKNIPWYLIFFKNKSIHNLEVGVKGVNDDKTKWLSISSSTIYIKQRKMVMIAFADITYRKQIEKLERLRQAELNRLGRINSMAQMSAALAHQMGQPLVSSLNYLHGCKLRLSKIDGTNDIQDSIVMAIKYLEKAGEILRHVREFVCKHEPKKEMANIEDVIRDTVSFLNFEIQQNQVRLSIETSDSVQQAPMCRIEIQQVIFNLIKNGIDAMKNTSQEDRFLIIGAKPAEGKHAVQIYVKDHGEGIESESASRVFEPYFSTKNGGMGIGLTICQSIIKSHGGELSFSKVGKQGSLFKFTLPIKAPEDLT